MGNGLTKADFQRMFQDIVFGDLFNADISKISTLLEQGVDPNIYNKEGQHPLWLAAYHNRSDIVELFVQYGAVVDLPTIDKYGETVLIAASNHGHIKCATVLLNHRAAVDYVNTNGNTALYYACFHEHVNIVNQLLEKGANVSKGTLPPVYGASEGGHLAIVELLVSRGARVNQPTNDDLAATPLLAACANNHPQVARYLISKGARVNYKNKQGDTSLHAASYKGHTAVVQLLIESQAMLDIKDNDGDTALDMARRRGYSKIVSLLERADHTSLAENEESSSDVQAEGGKPSEAGNEDGAAVSIPDRTSEQTSTEETPRDREASSNSTDTMIPVSKENYMCVAQSSNCLVYISKDVDLTFSIEIVIDTNTHPKIASNEIELTPIVRITPDNTTVSLDKPAIIELLKNVELSEKEAKNETIPLSAEIESSEWRELGSECNCKVHEDRISFEVTHFGLHAVISRKPFPSSTKIVKPSADTPAPTELTISELPGFKVQIPPCSVNADQDVEITATMLYDSSAVCSEEDRCCLASSCIGLEPHGMTLSNNASISIPIPEYAEVMENNPNAQLQVWQSDVTAGKQWSLVDHRLDKDKDGRYIATFETNRFSKFKAKFKNVISRLKGLFRSSFNIKARCQVFMSQEMVIKSQLMFAIAVLYYPYKDEPDSMPNYKYVLADSKQLDLQVSKRDKVQFAVELDEALLPLRCKPITGLFMITGRQQKSFTIKLDGNVMLSESLPMGELSIGVKGGLKQTMTLFKQPEPSSASSNLKIPYQLEESIVELEDSADRLGQDTIQYEESPGLIVEASKKIASMWMKMAELLRKECVLKERTCKDDIVEVAKNITKESQEVTRIATVAAAACTDSRMRTAVCGVVERTQTISHQLRVLARGETSRQLDEASDLEACKLLATNAKNLSMVISETLRHTHSACIRIDEVTKMKLGLSKIETVSGILNQEEQNNDDRSHSEPLPLSSIPNDGTRLGDDDHTWIYEKLEVRAAKWRDIGRAIGFKQGEMDNIQSNPMLLTQSPPQSWLREMLSQWLQWAPGDRRGSTSFATKDSLRTALLNANLGQLAQEFQ